MIYGKFALIIVIRYARTPFLLSVKFINHYLWCLGDREYLPREESISNV